MSQIVGTQAVMNVLTGRRWGLVSREMKDYLCGYYGKAPGPIDPGIMKKVGEGLGYMPDASEMQESTNETPAEPLEELPPEPEDGMLEISDSDSDAE